MPAIKYKSILVIGGSSGIGYGVADKALAEGAKVHIASSNKTRVEQSVSALVEKHPGAEVIGHVCDLSSSDVEAHLVKLLKEVKPLDHIVYTAGDALPIMPLEQVTLEVIHKAGHVRFFVPILLAKHAPKYTNPGYESSLTLTTGAGAEKPFPNWSAIAGYLTGLQGLTRSLALDLKPLRVNLVSPGVVDTPLHGGPGSADKLKDLTLLGKVGRVDEVAEAYLYFMKDTNVTGASISTNAGSLLL